MECIIKYISLWGAFECLLSASLNTLVCGVCLSVSLWTASLNTLVCGVRMSASLIH